MAKFYDHITPALKSFMENQHLFFVATAPASLEGRINLSPKGLDNFRVLSDKRVGYMDFIGSGNETSAHTLENGRITLMFCSFEKVPNILRLYGKGRAVLPGDADWEEISSAFSLMPSTRQIIIAEVDSLQTSCGYGVPLYEYQGERSILYEWADKKGVEGLKTYIKEKNQESIDGLPTHLKT